MDVYYDPKETNYRAILDRFFKLYNPKSSDKIAFRGGQYRTAIFYRSKQEKKIALKAKEKVEKNLGRKIYTQIKPAKEFYQAEEYHQDYYKKMGR